MPSRCLAKSRKAFLNEKLKRSGALSKEEDVTGDRFPEDADRVACRQLKHVLLVRGGQECGQRGAHVAFVRKFSRKSV